MFCVKVVENATKISSVNYAKENMQDKSISDHLLKIQATVKLPLNWFTDLTENKSDKELNLTFFTMALYNVDYQRLVEKQLILTSGIINTN